MTQLVDLRPETTPSVPLEQLVNVVSGTIVQAGPEVSGVTLDSKDVTKGDIFVGIPGKNRHGAEFAKAAIAAGAVAVASDSSGLEIIGKADPGIGLIEVENPRVWAGLAAAEVWDHPDYDLTTIGITGTNGKTTTSYFIHHALSEIEGLTLLIGTVGVTLGDVHAPSDRTSLEAPVLHRILAWAREKGARNVVMEVSSHALELHRVAGLRFDMVGFLNLQRDHLDYHGTMEDYYAAKAKLFDPDRAVSGVVCVDDQWGRRLAEEAAIPIETVATEDAADWSVAFHAMNSKDAGTDLEVAGPRRTLAMHCPMPGIINVQNQMVALAVLAGLGFPSKEVAHYLSETPQVPGRMEVIAKRDPETPLVIVDFAHTPDAMASACSALDPVTPGRLWCLFGATGDRDRGKRPMMAQVAAAHSDVVILTDDDIYSEDPAAIRAEVATGFTDDGMRAKQLWEDDDRAHAIRAAILGADHEDTILLAGRGHETTQRIGDDPHPLDDRQEAREAVQARAISPDYDVTECDEPSGVRPKLRKIPKTWEDLR